MKFKPKDPGSAITHFIGWLMALLAAVPLILRACTAPDAIHVISLSIFIVSMLLLYAASTLYHSLDINEKVNKRLKKFDGVHALAFARERMNAAGGDYQRAKNQQKVIATTYPLSESLCQKSCHRKSWNRSGFFIESGNDQRFCLLLRNHYNCYGDCFVCIDDSIVFL